MTSPSQYLTGAVRRNTSTGQVALRTGLPTPDGTLDWCVSNLDYGSHYAKWADVSDSNWVDVVSDARMMTVMANLNSEGQLKIGVAIRYGPPPSTLVLSGSGTLVIDVAIGN